MSTKGSKAPTRIEPDTIGLDPAQYTAMLRYLFDRPIPAEGEQEWFWSIEEPPFAATPLEWTRLQTVLFANAGTDLASYADEQVGMGLNYVMSNSVSNVPFAAIDPGVPLHEAMRMMEAMPALWRDCYGPRLASVRSLVGAVRGRLEYTCYIWFDEWSTFSNARKIAEWRDAVWRVLVGMLAVPCRAVQIAGLHGIGHHVDHLVPRDVIDRTIQAFVKQLGDKDEALAAYADAARRGMVQ